MFYNGQWGTVCQTSWDINDARVVCRQLGFPGALAAISDKRYTPGNGPIVVDSVHCTGEEEGIQYCLHGGWMKKKCPLISHVGVVCEDVGGCMHIIAHACCNVRKGSMDQQTLVKITSSFK